MIPRWIILLFFAGLSTAGCASSSNSRPETLPLPLQGKVNPNAVVNLLASRIGDPPNVKSSSSGFFAGDTCIPATYHATGASVGTIAVRNAFQTTTATLFAADQANDLTVLRAAREFPSLEVTDKNSPVRSGDELYAIGRTSKGILRVTRGSGHVSWPEPMAPDAPEAIYFFPLGGARVEKGDSGSPLIHGTDRKVVGLLIREFESPEYELAVVTPLSKRILQALMIVDICSK